MNSRRYIVAGVSSAERLSRYAQLAVEVGANVQPGQFLLVQAYPEQAALARAIAAHAYKVGARFVDVNYADQRVRRSLIESGPREMLPWSPPWLVDRLDYATAEQAAKINFSGDPEPGLLADLDPVRVAESRQTELVEASLRQHVEETGCLVADRRPDRGLGQDGFRRAGYRAALAGGRARRQAR